MVDLRFPPRLTELLEAEPDRDFAARLHMVCLAASRTIAALGELDLVQYEEPDVEGSADLGMWEMVAPIIGSTLAEVNALNAQIEASFPTGEFIVDARQAEVDRQLQEALAALKEQVMGSGQLMRDPSVVGDRWNLITALQMFRSRFRDRIGQMVFEAASVLGDCRRRDVEPGYEETLATTLLVRAMTSDLRRLMRARIHKVSDAPPTEMQAQARAVEKELAAFGRTAVWRVLRAQDKKGILEFRQRVRALEAVGAPSKLELLEVLEPFVEFVDGFAAVSRREILVQHDQEVLASVGVLLEQAMNTDAYEGKAAAFREAIDRGQTLYGRSTGFDLFLRAQRQQPVPPPEALPGALENFLVQLAGLSQY